MTILLQKRCLLANLHKCKTLTSVKDYIFIKVYYQGRRKQCEAAGAVISKGICFSAIIFLSGNIC
jgi:hypothetical protein